jgi:hypothetical protein
MRVGGGGGEQGIYHIADYAEKIKMAAVRVYKRVIAYSYTCKY